APPLLINTVPRDGRAACCRCAMCVGFACPTDAKNGSHNVPVPRALRTGRCTLVTEAQVERVTPRSPAAPATIAYFTADGARRTATARAIVVSCGAIESARLLLNSATDAHPRGLGNDSDQVGRHLQGHYYPSAFGQFDEVTYDGIGPGVSVATCDYNHGNPGDIVGGGMLANDFIMVPIVFQKWAWPPDVPRWGLAAKRWMRDNFRRVFDVKGPVQEIPNPESRVTVDLPVRDRFGIPVARLSGEVHPETLRTAGFLRDRAIDWLQASGAKRVWSRPIVPFLSGGQHQAGTCRMGSDPRTSVCDPFGRVHGTDDVFVVDGSLHVTNGGFNPVLTIMALAFRNAAHVTTTL
ncbi:MAG TPA: GMC oxidoreductase, partial [Tepidisphaeraceae bacterium]|nr:GMC oxidoreductase [Tepidisphaeraceae bacterium]